jgi:hypothetical protein
MLLNSTLMLLLTDKYGDQLRQFDTKWREQNKEKHQGREIWEEGIGLGTISRT